jgi:hypothetical protein
VQSSADLIIDSVPSYRLQEVLVLRFSQRALVAVLSLFLGSACMLPSSVAQNRTAPPVGQQNAPEDEGTIRMKKDMAKKANSERHEALKRDTDHLLELAQQLKDQVDKSSENTLSLDVMKKAEEIEKLAHSVKEKMKGY